MHKFSWAAAAGLATVLASTGAMAGKDLDAIRARGALICGVGQGTAGFMMADSQGMPGVAAYFDSSTQGGARNADDVALHSRISALPTTGAHRSR